MEITFPHMSQIPSFIISSIFLIRMAYVAIGTAPAWLRIEEVNTYENLVHSRC